MIAGVLQVVGAVGLTIGIALISVPFAVISGSILCISAGILIDRRAVPGTDN